MLVIKYLLMGARLACHHPSRECLYLSVTCILGCCSGFLRQYRCLGKRFVGPARRVLLSKDVRVTGTCPPFRRSWRRPGRVPRRCASVNRCRKCWLDSCSPVYTPRLGNMLELALDTGKSVSADPCLHNVEGGTSDGSHPRGPGRPLAFSGALR